jgi:hypothetical protein
LWYQYHLLDRKCAATVKYRLALSSDSVLYINKTATDNSRNLIMGLIEMPDTKTD